MKPCDFGHMFYMGILYPGHDQKSKTNGCTRVEKKIAVRLEAQRMNASNIYTKTNAKETSRPLISKQTAEDNSRNGRSCAKGKDMSQNGRK